ncbi:MAG: site-specific DNA-methyltransferase [Nitrososphaeria archaeon]
MKEKYKVIEIKLNRNLDNKEIKIIEELGKRYSKEDLFFQIDGDKILFNLRTIDLNSFKNSINSLSEKYNYSPREQNVFLELIEKIEGIKSYGIKAGKRIYVDYDKERKVQDRQKKILQRGMFFYARDNNFTKEVNEVPNEFVNKIICGDSEQVLKKLPANCVDLIFTSPPYNFGLGYDTTEDGIDWNKYFDKLFAIFKECIRVLKFGGRIIVNVQPLFSDYIPIHHIISNFFMQNKLIWKGEIIWDKHNYNCKYTAWGSWKSPSNPYLKYTWEFLEIFCKGDIKHKGSSNESDITGEEFKKWIYAKWDIAPERNMKKYDHPAMFPEELVTRVLKLFSFKNDFILDPFNGVGSTTLVAKKLGRRFLGIDISEKYCKTAEKRIKELLDNFPS